MSRPELLAPPEIFYNEKEAAKYNSCSRIIKIQEQLAMRAIELLHLPENQESFILDVGCGSGLSGAALEAAGHAWVGVDISQSMLQLAAERDSSGDVFHQDIGTGLPFRPGIFDGCISISAIQWLCYSESNTQIPRRRLLQFFSSLYACLKRGTRAILQLYPENPEQMEEISSCAMRSGFSGGLVIDYPNSAKAKKYYLCLFAGYDAVQAMPQALDDSSQGIIMQKRKRVQHKASKLNPRAYVLAKKERYRKQGKKVKADSKYTARPRPRKF